ncbi:DUF1116 domain-containing protein [Aquabacter sp. L1I39]|uniref:DUF1116 domain-containing protein n=1 Tax=Aquabacter sp. L1I39 TaxID=2820278 RepID=UPI001ADB0A2C|nr:DUF1116 domain-containing protein [Aquabacter sp. L1I39]QTL02679.1 DUF1116 domain-containing protein [Aquabacter sp. L1I39]
MDDFASSPALSDADRAALARMHAVVPAWRGIGQAGDVMGLPARTLLHAGPPIDLARVARPVLNSAVMAALLENWASDAVEAEARILAGDIRLAPAQDHQAMVPLAAILSPSMAVHVVIDLAAPGRRIFTPINGGMAKAQRLGLAGPDILAHLRWINGNLAATLSIIADQDVALLPIADAALLAGDDCHGRPAMGSRYVIEAIAPRLGTDTLERHFLDGAPGFFLNIWMAAAKLMAGAGETPGSSLITAMGANGVNTGLQLGGRPGQWFTIPATPPDGPLAAGVSPHDRLGAIGDSALVDALGFGGMLAAPGEPLRARLLPLEHPAFAESRARVGLPAAGLVAYGAPLTVTLGILDRAGRRGRIGGGLYSPPLSLFAEALQGLS